MNHIAVHNIEEIKPILEDHARVLPQRLGEELVKAKLIKVEQLREALHRQQHQNPGRHLGQILLDMSVLNQAQLDIMLARMLGIPYVKLRNFEVAADLLARLPAEVAHHYNVLPLGEVNGKLVVAMENPLDYTVVNAVRFNVQTPIEAVMAPAQDINFLVHKHYSLLDEHEAVAHFKAEGEQAGKPMSVLQLMQQEAQRKPIVRLLDSIMMQGISRGASDINIRPEKDAVMVYYRIDGRLQYARTLNKTLLPPLISRLKIIGRMDIAERRVPQDGHARVNWERRAVDLRLSIIPTINGESAVIRVLDKEAGFRPLTKLGLQERELQLLQQIIAKPHGMFLVTGPTGSGKSTTLYALLNEVKKKGVHILTVEDPVEYHMEGVEQSQIFMAKDKEYTFARALRHFLRHDPDVIMVGEIRDQETAQIANRAAMTGHMVFSTLHTNSAAATIGRLRDMGVESYLLSSTLLGIMAQRLVRFNCPHCLAPEIIDPYVRQVLKLRDNERFHKGLGCETCNGVGYQGRVSVCELLYVTPEIAELINSGAPTQKIQAVALTQGMTTLLNNALALARSGKTTIEEVYGLYLEV